MSTVVLFPSWLMLMLLGGGGGLPLGVPPLPEDPVLARVAPAECLAYTSWSGTAAPNAASKNQTEQLLAEPEVQDMFRQIERAVMTGVEKNGPPQKEMVALRRDVIRWGKTVLTRPTAVFLSSVAINKDGPDIRGGIVMNAGDDAVDLQATIEKYLKSATASVAKKVEIRGIPCYRVKLGPGAPDATWCVKDKYLFVGVGEGSLEGILDRANGSVPAWLTTLRKQLPVERLSTVTYVNVKKLVDQFAPLGGPKLSLVIDAAGLGNVTTLSAVTGLDGEGFVNRTLLGIQGKPTGVLSLAVGKPLAAKDLTAIPRDATFAVAGRLDVARLMDAILAIVERIEPRATEELQRNLYGVKEQLGVDLRKDVVDSLGDVWCAYNSPDEGGLVITGITAVVQVTDYERLSAALNKLVAVTKARLGQIDRPEEAAGPKTAEQKDGEEERIGPMPMVRPSARIEKVRYAGQDVYFLSTDTPFAPAWCLTKKELIVAAFPQQIKAYLSRGADFKSLAAVPEVADALAAGEGPIGLSYVDTRQIADYLYPMICVGAQLFSRELARQGIDLNVSMIPSAPTIYKHLRPSVSTVRRTDAGIEFTSRGTMPGASLGTAVPLLAGFYLPAVASARGSAQRAQSMNNMKQIALGMLNYESTYNRYPPAFIADKKTDKPLLSWRVAILPFIEQDALYKQFHLDEPWDSDHNKKLLERMPQIYRSPASTAKPGMANYLTVRGKDTAFPGKEGIRMADITDGTSNTIMVVEANDAKAVPWTKPDDYEYDEKNPAAGLGGLFPNGFNAAFCDGSVHFIPNSIDAETLRNLFNRHDGNWVDRSKF